MLPPTTIGSRIDHPSIADLPGNDLEKIPFKTTIEDKISLFALNRIEPNQEKIDTINPESQCPDLPYPGASDRQTQQDTVDKLTSLSEPGNMADIFMIMAEFHKLSMAMRDASKQTAHAELETQVSHLMDQAQNLHKAADEAKTAGLVAGILQIVGGVAQMGFSIGGLVNAANQAVSQALNSMGGALSSISTGAGGVVSSTYNAQSQDYNADATEEQAKATRAAGERDEMQKFEQNMQENMRATLDALRQIMQSREQTVSKIFA